MSIASWRRQLRGALIEWKDAGADADEVVDLIEGLISLKVDEMLQAKKDTAPETSAVREICAKPLDGVDAGDLCERQEGHTGNCGLDPI